MARFLVHPAVLLSFFYGVFFSACSGDSFNGEAVNVKDALSDESELDVETVDDLPSCTKGREGFIIETKEDGIFVCKSGSWEEKSRKKSSQETEEDSTYTGWSGDEDDDSGKTKKTDVSSSSREIILSVASETSPLNSTSYINGSVVPDGKGGFELTLTGSLEMNPNFIPEEHDESEDFWFTFDSLSFTVGKYGDDGKAYLVDSLNIVGNIQFPVDRIPMATSYKQIPLNQDKIGCGEFVLYVWIYMSLEEDPSLRYTALKQVDFTLPCKVVESSSSAGTCTELDRQEITLQNLKDGDVYTMNLDGGTDAQLTLVVENPTIYLQAAANVKIWEDGGALIGGVDPRDPVCMESMVKDDRTGTEKMEMDAGTLWYIVTTPVGMYPMRVIRRETSDATTGILGLVYYVKK